MADEARIARPYAEAAFRRAVETGAVESWSDALGLLAAVAADPLMSGLLASPRVGRARAVALVLDIAGTALNEEQRNFVRLLADNGRFALLGEIAPIYEARRREHEGRIEVELTSAYPLDDTTGARLAEALKRRLGREVRLRTRTDHGLIGGFRVRAGDLVIDASVRAKLERMAQGLGATLPA